MSSRCWVFASLANRNYRRYFAGQAVSLPGTWMQSIAQSWLVVQLTGSGTMLGLLVAMQTLPVLLLTPYAASSSTAPTNGGCCWAPSLHRRYSRSGLGP